MLKKCFIALLLTFLAGCQSRDSNLPKKPYDAWELVATFPKYFNGSVRNILVNTQNNKQYSSLTTTVIDNQAGS